MIVARFKQVTKQINDLFLQDNDLYHRNQVQILYNHEKLKRNCSTPRSVLILRAKHSLLKVFEQGLLYQDICALQVLAIFEHEYNNSMTANLVHTGNLLQLIDSFIHNVYPPSPYQFIQVWDPKKEYGNWLKLKIWANMTISFFHGHISERVLKSVFDLFPLTLISLDQWSTGQN